ncbi:major facilitator superfamily domain-containing protein 8 [Ditylenchus destructor]|nr:major facilitator superfamily domain-containing protein 8 [Ditylenchus destructor]
MSKTVASYGAEIGKPASYPENEWRTNWKSIYIVTLVAFISEVNRYSTPIWAYLHQLDSSVSESFNGVLGSSAGFGIMLSAIGAGFVSNRLQDTKWAMIFAKVLAISSYLLYLSFELINNGTKWAFLAFQFLCGLSIGSANIYKTHVAMASTEVDRPKAVGVANLGPTIGFIAGPIVQIISIIVPYPGVPLIFGIHVNLFTIPIMLTIMISVIGLTLLVFCFDGRMRVYPKTMKPDTEMNLAASNSRLSLESTDDSDNGLSEPVTNLGAPYGMTFFEWDSSETVKYNSIILLLIGLQVIGWNLGYVFLNLRERLPERKGIIISLFVLLAAYVFTYPWPFLTGKIVYEHESSPAKGNHSQKVGCPRQYDWCATTPSVNMYMFLGSIILTLGVAVPLANINLDILFSKILGKIKQGTMQGIFIACGDGLTIILPIIISEVYVLSGPSHIWKAIIGLIAVCLILWFILYHRMAPPLTFIVNVFKFFDRNDLEIVSTSGEYVNRIVRKHFASKPYRFLNDVTLTILRDEDGLVLLLGKDAVNQSSGIQNAENQYPAVLYFDPNKNEWADGRVYFDLDIMRPYLTNFVRFGETNLLCHKRSFTPDDVTILASLSHLWSGRSLSLSIHLDAQVNFRKNATNSIRNVLTDDAIFSCRCFELHDIAQFVSLHNYYRIYTIDVLLLKSYNDEHLNIKALLALIKHKPQFPESKTVFVVDLSTFETEDDEVTDAIRESFSTASTPSPFQLMIIDYSESEEFRLENGTTREVLQLTNIKKDSLFVTKFFEICNDEEFPDRFTLIERSSRF